MALVSINYLTLAKYYAILINAGSKTISDVPDKVITGLANGVISGTYTFTDIPEVLKDTVKSKILEINSTYTFE